MIREIEYIEGPNPYLRSIEYYEGDKVIGFLNYSLIFIVTLYFMTYVIFIIYSLL